LQETLERIRLIAQVLAGVPLLEVNGTRGHVVVAGEEVDPADPFHVDPLGPELKKTCHGSSFSLMTRIDGETPAQDRLSGNSVTRRKERRSRPTSVEPLSMP